MRWIPWLIVAACSSGTGAPARPGPAPVGPPADAGVASPIAPTERECNALVEHAIQLGAAATADRPPEQRATQADQEQLELGLRPFVDECRALSRDRLRCGIAATTLAELAACHSTPSSSTSNSSVAPGGITPPAPRSP